MDRWENAAQERLSIGRNFHSVGGMRFGESFEVNFWEVYVRGSSATGTRPLSVFSTAHKYTVWAERRTAEC